MAKTRFVSLSLLVIGLGAGLTGCQSSDTTALTTGPQVAQLRPLTANERAADFDQLLSMFKTYYGPYEYKQERFGYKIEEVIASLKEKAMQAKTDEEFAGLVVQFGAVLQDGHVHLGPENSSSGIARYRVPILLTPVEHRALVGQIEKALSDSTGIAVGDEILEVDGQAPFAYMPTILKYSAMAHDISNEHMILRVLSRPSYMTELVPHSSMVRLKVKTAGGETLIRDIPWLVGKYNPDLEKLVPSGRLDMSVPFAKEYNSVVKSNIALMGDVNPFFVNPRTQKQFGLVKVYPSDEARRAFGLQDSEKPPIYAALYRYGGKNILLVRQATYAPSDFKGSVYLRAYMALFSEYQDLADVLVVDQTHNPGGSYCADFYDLFARENDVQSVQLLRADRNWINELMVTWVQESPDFAGTWDAHTVAAWGQQVEEAYDQGRFLSDAIPLFTGSFFSTPRGFTWEKPMLVLIDELAGSCGDMFPMLVKANGRAKLFGQRTMGLGGNVVEIGILNNSRIHVNLTRGLFYPYNPNRAPLREEFIENNGVSPDYVYDHTVSDFRSGYVNYVKTFSEKALEQLSH